MRLKELTGSNDMLPFVSLGSHPLVSQLQGHIQTNDNTLKSGIVVLNIMSN